MSAETRIVCLCGSSRFERAFDQAAEAETLAGRIVLTLGIRKENSALSAEQLELLRRLHRQRIDLSDEVFVVNPGGYVGESTADEIEYARARGKPIRWLVEPATRAYEGNLATNRTPGPAFGNTAEPSH